MKFEFKYYSHCLLTLALLSIVVRVSFAQIEFTEHTIADNFFDVRFVCAADIDGDGDMDVLGAAHLGNRITWWENDGEQNFTEHTIAGNFDGANSVYAADIDGDGDIDVLGAASHLDDITWWENDGEQHFTEHTIAGGSFDARFVYAADIDGDGDIDVLGAAVADGITWWENDGEQDFTEHTIAGNFAGANSVYAADIDGDGDMDVLGAGYNDSITWWENDGEQEFTEHTIAGDFDGALSVYTADIDGDGDMDVLGAASGADDITWWENDGEQDFTEHTIAGDFDGASSVYATDIDSDGDMDVLGAAQGARDITWWENDGEQDFTEHTIADEFRSAYSVYAADIDGDGDMDVLGTAYSTGDITWWENDLAVRMIEGFVFDFRSEQPLEGAVVATSYGFESVTNEDGFWQISPARFGPFDLTASITGYNDSTLVDLEVELGDTLEIDFALLHPELTLSIEDFNEAVPPESSVELHFTMINEGSGLLEWSVVRLLIGESGVDPWEMRQSHVIGNTLEDSRLQGVVFVDDHFFVSGGGNETNMIYVLDRDGQPVRSFPQLDESNYGMKDLAWDGELIWGVPEETVYGFNTDGDSITSFQGPFNGMAAIAWDPDRELLWISEITTDIHGYDREGNHDQLHELSRHGLRIYGLAYMPGDSLSLYIFNSPGDNRQVVHKMNPDNGDTLFVSELIPEGSGGPVGAFITDQFDRFGSWVFMDIANAGGDDRIDIWQLKPNTDWMSVDPSEGIIQPDRSQELTLTLSTEGLDSTLEWQGELIFSQAVGGDDTVIPITMTISSFNSVKDKGAHTPSEFGISSIYPNPFNSSTTITYGMPVAARVSLKIYDITGREVMTLIEGNRLAGFHRAVLNATDMPSGLYFVRLEAAGRVFTRKTMLIR